ncbi:MAG: hypothetical protein ABI623_06070, partial [bacterium]
MNKPIIIVSVLFLLQMNGFAGTSDELVKSAWRALEGKGQVEAESKFKEAIALDKSNTRAYIGLSLLYDMQDRKNEAWNTFRNVLTIEKNYYPYISAQWLFTWDEKIRTAKNTGIIDLLEKLSNGADPDGILKAQASEQLGTYFLNRGDLPVARGWFSKMNAITTWMVCGPFDNISASGFEKSFPPEREFDTTKTYEGKNGIPATWFQPAAMRLDRWVDFTRYFAFQQAAFYANNFLYSPRKQQVQIRIGTSGSLKAFLNDEEIIQYFDENNNDLDTYIVETELQQGWNRLLIKCG